MTNREKELLKLASDLLQRYRACNPDVGYSCSDPLVDVNKTLSQPFTEEELNEARTGGSS
jgi:hypothetical protein